MGNRVSGDDAASPDFAPKIAASGSSAAGNGYSLTSAGSLRAGSSSKKHRSNRSVSGDTANQYNSGTSRHDNGVPFYRSGSVPYTGSGTGAGAGTGIGAGVAGSEATRYKNHGGSSEGIKVGSPTMPSYPGSRDLTSSAQQTWPAGGQTSTSGALGILKTERQINDCILQLSQREKRAIKRSWICISSELKNNGKEFFLKFFEFHPGYVDYFSAFKGKSLEDLQSNKLVQAHGISVMYLFTTLVENVNDPLCFTKFMSNSIRIHRTRGVLLAQYQEIFDVLIFFLEEKLAERFDQVTKDAWHKFAANFAYHVIHTSQNGDDDEEEWLRGGGVGAGGIKTHSSYSASRQTSESSVDANNVVFT